MSKLRADIDRQIKSTVKIATDIVTEIFNVINNWKEFFSYCKIDILYGICKEQEENKRTRKLLRGLTVLSMWYDIICNLVSETKRMVNDL